MEATEKRRLLELAAKAAGYPVDMNCEASGWYANGYNDDGSVSRWWNPLDDDGDALRLAVKLDIEYYQGDDDGPAVFAGYWGKPERRDVTRMFCVEAVNNDPCAATRLAIVRAAAALGESLP